MKNKAIAISLALCLMSGSVMACSSSKEKTTDTSSESIKNEEINTSTAPSESESEESIDDVVNEEDVVDVFDMTDSDEDEPYYVCPPAIVVPSPETMEFYANNYRDIIAKHEAETGCTGKAHEVTFFDIAYDGAPEMFVWCKEGNGDVFMIYKNPDNEDFCYADLFTSRGDIDMFSEDTAIWLGGDCDGTCSRLYSVSCEYDNVSETDRDVTETVYVIENALSFDGFYRTEDVEVSKYATRTYHETLDEEGNWQASESRYYVFFNDEGYCDEPQECDEILYYRPNPAQMVGYNRGFGSVLPEDVDDADKLFNDFMAIDAVSFPITFG